MGVIFNVIKKLIKIIIKLSIYLAIFAAVIVLIPNLPPYTKFTRIVISPTQPRLGPLAPNEALNNAARLYKAKLLGPEAFQIYKGELYTSLATGEIVKLSPEGHVTFVTTVGQPCTGLTKEHICGRPLGFQIDDKDNSLYVADAYHGIWKVDLKTDKKQLLVSPRVEIEKRLPKLFNSIALGKNGDFYWTDSTSDFHLKDGAISMLTDPSGRLLHYDAAKNLSKVLLDDLWFANGVVLSPNNDFVVVAETVRSKLSKYYIAGPKKGKSEVFVDGLPGTPDNMRVLPDGSGILVGLYTVYDGEHPAILRSLAPTPIVRKFLARLQQLIEKPFEYLNNLYPHIVFEDIVYYIGHFQSMSGLTPAGAGLVQLDWNGNIVAAYYNTDRTLGHISDAIVFNNKLYTGSPHLQDFVGAVPAPTLLRKAFEPKKPETAKVETKTQGGKPVQQAPTQKTVEQPKAKVEEKPKAETKPTAEPKPIEDKPKVAQVKEASKVIKPTVEAAKPEQQPKPAQPPKQVQEPSPSKPSAKSTAVPPKVTAPPPKTTASGQQAKKATQTEPKPTTPKGEVKTTPPPKPTEKTTPPPKPTEKTTPLPKPTEKTTPPAPKPITSKPKETKVPEEPKKAQPPVKQEPAKTAESKPKPIKEEIPSDTVKPTKEKLRVIKKDGPAEIPVPQ